MKVSFFHNLICVLIITMLIPGIMPFMVAAAEDVPSENDGNSTISLPDLVINSLKYPENPNPGDFQDIYISVKNRGTASSEKTGTRTLH